MDIIDKINEKLNDEVIEESKTLKFAEFLKNDATFYEYKPILQAIIIGLMRGGDAIGGEVSKDMDKAAKKIDEAVTLINKALVKFK